MHHQCAKKIFLINLDMNNTTFCAHCHIKVFGLITHYDSNWLKGHFQLHYTYFFLISLNFNVRYDAYKNYRNI